jgi:hypothetical protein
MAIEQHEERKTALAEAELGEALRFGIEDEVAGTQEVEEGGSGGGVEIGVAEGGLEEALKAGEFFEEEERHGLGEGCKAPNNKAANALKATKTPSRPL